ncbi:ABC transporter substrate-binding protein [Thalassobium sp. R2A62]|jgi:peptide/nickel transport system substrate-binding protein|uniref:ABC transporter substrate-binding protein n=1 Tax=Thalassobium sp. R2A62 TaxID=633131 RepID=UPI0001B1D640|nr:ABC transporter substrate-binding protein [Thalassobium sp. R2A62]EET49596.1 oligopeptide ABC transporter periplasmic oligopeptide binding protein [Thalassobium sp. R2A62]MDG2453808.1 ABC transporter substrate-binding protein [Paracoccaceae bacterium]
MKKLILTGVMSAVLPTLALADCPAITAEDMQGIGAGAYPNQFELVALQDAASCEMGFSENPSIAALNSEIRGNADLPPVADRLPDEPLVIVPFASIGEYGGTFNALSNATESGTSDFLSVRHTTLFRYSTDLETIVPNVAKDWAWNDDFTQLTVTLRRGHKWSDGADFTSADVVFWYDNLMMDSNVIENAKDYALAGGEPMTVTAPDAQTVVFDLAAPKPGLIETFTSSFIQPFQPVHFLGQYHPEINPDADALAQAAGFENGYEVVKAYFGSSDWTDTPTMMFIRPNEVGNLPADTMPTLESHIIVAENTEGRHLVANPYFHQVDTAGNQLPYINEQDERYVPDTEVRTLTLINGGVTYKSQSVTLDMLPVLLDSAESGNYSVDVNPGISFPVLAFNVTSEDLAKREIFGDLRFRTAMSVAMNRDEINEVVFFDLGTPTQYTTFSPYPEFADPAWESHEIAYDVDRANALLDEMGLVDADGDGKRDLPNGDPFVLNIQFSTQELSAQLIEIAGQNWADVGVASVIKEVTPDEYRSAQSANQLDLMSWSQGAPLGVAMGSNELHVPPFSTYFNARNGMLWAEWIDSDGANGVEPPAYVMGMIDDVNAMQVSAPGSDEQAAAANGLIEAITSNLLFIGTVKSSSPTYYSNDLQNVIQFKTTSYDFYRAYPYNPTQWWLSE